MSMVIDMIIKPNKTLNYENCSLIIIIRTNYYPNKEGQGLFKETLDTGALLLQIATGQCTAYFLTRRGTRSEEGGRESTFFFFILQLAGFNFPPF